jgi:hypothetical protein
MCVASVTFCKYLSSQEQSTVHDVCGTTLMLASLYPGPVLAVEFVTYASLSACDEVVEVMEAVGASERVLDLLEQPAAPQVHSNLLHHLTHCCCCGWAVYPGNRIALLLERGCWACWSRQQHSMTLLHT